MKLDCKFIFFAGKPTIDKAENNGVYGDGNEYYADGEDYYYSDDEYLNEDEHIVHTIPTFKSDPTDQLVNEGETIKLPCAVDKLCKFTNLIIYL